MKRWSHDCTSSEDDKTHVGQRDNANIVHRSEQNAGSAHSIGFSDLNGIGSADAQRVASMMVNAKAVAISLQPKEEGLLSFAPDRAEMNVLIADDHTIIRRGVKNLIEFHIPSAATQVARSIAEVDDFLAKKGADLLILDLLLTDGNAFDRIPAWISAYPQTRILVYSQCSAHLYAARLLALGCSGFVSKEESEERLLEAIRQVNAGGTVAMPSLSQSKAGADGPNFDKLSDREVRVMEEVLRGVSIKDISQRLAISPSTVATYKARLFDKLGVTSELELRRLAEIYGIFRS